jgi:redox-sensitive bicupin YhaK (pirin superfamily)
LIHVFDGDAHVNDHAVTSGQMAVFERSEGTVRIVAGEAGAEVLVLGGEPLGEPVARYGPFVMNTREELMTAVQEFNDGTLVKVGKATL